jgi:WD40 repeat protein
MKQSSLFSFFSVGNNKKRERDDEINEKLSETRKMAVTSEKENSNPFIQEKCIQNDSETTIPSVENHIIEEVHENVDVKSDRTTIIAEKENSSLVMEEKPRVNDSDVMKASKNSELSDYELVRLENIRRNEEFLASLGLQGPSIANVARVSVIKTTAKAKQTSKTVEKEALPTRRSARVASIPADDNKYVADNIDAIEEEEEDEEEEEKVYDDSDVIRYVMDNKFSHKSAACSSDRIQFYHPINTENIVSSPDLPAIYSMEYHPQYYNMLLAGGKGGYVSLFRMPENQQPSTSGDLNNHLLFSWRAHNRWISTVKFLNYSSTNKVSIISAADDATVKIWDMGTRVTTTSSKANSITPQLLATYDSIHDKGVYSLDISPDQTKLVTGSKDKTIAISTITESVISNTLILNELHHSVVKTVAFHTSDNNLIASGGQDRRVSVKDLRANEAPDIIIDNAHNGGVHTVFFNKNSGGNMLVTAGFDPVINLFDIRNPKDPLYRFIGHHSASTKTYKTILTPAIVTPSNSSEFIIASGEGNAMLSLYDVATGKTISRGSCVDQPASIAVKHDGSSTIGLSFRSKSLAGSILELQATSEPI